jgi:hypothetical protein
VGFKRNERRRLKVIMNAHVERSIASRPCGECSACCTALAVVEIEKEAGTACCHIGQEGKGCSIYPDRPRSCRDFQCLWRIGAGRDDERPDRVGIVLDTTRPGHAGHPGMVALEAWPGAFEDSYEFLRRIASEGDGRLVFLVKGHQPRRVLGPEAELRRIGVLLEELRAANQESNQHTGIKV